MEGHTTITLVDLDGEPKAPKDVDRTVVNQCGYYVRENIPISYKLWKKVKSTNNAADVIPDTEKPPSSPYKPHPSEGVIPNSSPSWARSDSDGMVRVKLTAKLIDTLEEIAADECPRPQVENEEDISSMQASPSELMASEKPEPTLKFGSSKVTQRLIDFYITKGFSKAGQCRPPQDEDTPNP
ncbi:hypothetical protein C2845_PM03G30310 [Panicum miliaceum]|uniref:Uncharacterized protein n=1 Tax=Panicum miliaceum TaxID=4540 RepID=A0A3L6TGK9_PANMI|nr:hypothetical protein C2845_PM03G30310 [Panicum miliaceum]